MAEAELNGRALGVGPAEAPRDPVDGAALERAVFELLRAIGEDPTREGLRETPRRVAEMYRENFRGLQPDPAALLEPSFDERHEEMIILCHIPFSSV